MSAFSGTRGTPTIALRLIHTSDWQIGKVFRFVDDATMGLLQEARLAAITRIGELALVEGVRHVLVAGDVYDLEALSPRSINQPLERMRIFEPVVWHLLPGNHDPHRPDGLWDRLIRQGLPENVVVHHTPEPRLYDADRLAVLPAPLRHRRTLEDPTAYMDAAVTPEGYARIGLAHGTITGFGAEDEAVANLIRTDRPASAGLDYLALGDWHGQKQISERIWYSGTHETDAFDVSGGGQALLVELPGGDSAPRVTLLETGHYQWRTLNASLGSRADVDDLAVRLRGLGGELGRFLVRLKLEGALSLADRRYFEVEIVDRVAAAFCHLQADLGSVYARPSAEDLAELGTGGYVRAAAEVLKRRAEDPADADRLLAARALERLYIEHMKVGSGQK